MTPRGPPCPPEISLFLSMVQLDVREFQASLVKEENKLKTLLPPDRDLTDVTSPNGQQGEGERAGEGEGGGEGGREVAEEVAKQITVVKYLRVS